MAIFYVEGNDAQTIAAAAASIENAAEQRARAEADKTGGMFCHLFQHLLGVLVLHHAGQYDRFFPRKKTLQRIHCRLHTLWVVSAVKDKIR